MTVVCLFGGAFNPPHRAHEKIARVALAQLPIDRLLVVPSGQHPLKDDSEMAPAEHRLELCRLAFAGLGERVVVDDREIRRPGPSYTIDTVEELSREYGSRPWMLLGSDNVPELPAWRRWRDLLTAAEMAVFPRPGHPLDERLLTSLGLDGDERARLLSHVLDMEPDPVSASEIRARVRRGEPIAELVAPAVERRIRELGLYRTPA